MGDEFDVIVIGGGTAGETAAWYARDNGLEVALVERELVGGDAAYRRAGRCRRMDERRCHNRQGDPPG